MANSIANCRSGGDRGSSNGTQIYARGRRPQIFDTRRTEEEKQNDSDQLANLDKDRDGFVTKSQLEKLGIKWADVAVFDLNSDRKLSRAEFNILVLVSKDVKETNYLNHFRAPDTNHDGFVMDQELKNRMTELGRAEGKVGTLATAQQMIRDNDKNGDGKLDYYEYKKAFFNKG